MAQTYTNWDYTILNNCSTDGTLAIAEEYAAKDPRIRVVNNAKFLRVIANHNEAMRLASPASKYCKMVFADDWMYPECLEKMVALAECNVSVGIVGSYRLVGNAVQSDGPTFGKPVVSGREICRAVLLRGIYPFGTSTSLLFRGDLVRGRNPYFNESNFHADSETCYELLKESDFGFVHQVLTFTRVQMGTLSFVSLQKGTLFAGNLGDLLKFGPFYLRPEEFQATLRERLRDYYRFLGRAVFERRRKGFLAFHAGKLKELGLSRPYVLSKRILRAIRSKSGEVSAEEVRIREQHHFTD